MIAHIVDYTTRKVHLAGVNRRATLVAPYTYFKTARFMSDVPQNLIGELHGVIRRPDSEDPSFELVKPKLHHTGYVCLFKTDGDIEVYFSTDRDVHMAFESSTYPYSTLRINELLVRLTTGLEGASSFDLSTGLAISLFEDSAPFNLAYPLLEGDFVDFAEGAIADCDMVTDIRRLPVIPSLGADKDAKIFQKLNGSGVYERKRVRGFAPSFASLFEQGQNHGSQLSEGYSSQVGVAAEPIIAAAAFTLMAGIKITTPRELRAASTDMLAARNEDNIASMLLVAEFWNVTSDIARFSNLYSIAPGGVNAEISSLLTEVLGAIEQSNVNVDRGLIGLFNSLINSADVKDVVAASPFRGAEALSYESFLHAAKSGSAFSQSDIAFLYPNLAYLITGLLSPTPQQVVEAVEQPNGIDKVAGLQALGALFRAYLTQNPSMVAASGLTQGNIILKLQEFQFQKNLVKIFESPFGNNPGRDGRTSARDFLVSVHDPNQMALLGDITHCHGDTYEIVIYNRSAQAEKLRSRRREAVTSFVGESIRAAVQSLGLDASLHRISLRETADAVNGVRSPGRRGDLYTWKRLGGFNVHIRFTIPTPPVLSVLSAAVGATTTSTAIRQAFRTSVIRAIEAKYVDKIPDKLDGHIWTAFSVRYGYLGIEAASIADGRFAGALALIQSLADGAAAEAPHSNLLVRLAFALKAIHVNAELLLNRTNGGGTGLAPDATFI